MEISLTIKSTLSRVTPGVAIQARWGHHLLYLKHEQDVESDSIVSGSKTRISSLLERTSRIEALFFESRDAVINPAT